VTTTALQLEAELAGEERAIRHLIGERAALGSSIKRHQAREKLLEAELKAITTRNHPAVGNHGGPIPHGERFPDDSSYQPHVDYAAVRHADSVRVGLLAFVKVSEGGGWTDPYGARRLREMADAGFPHRGGYHFFHPAVSPVDQAHHFLDAAHAAGAVLGPADVLACDAEVTDGEPARVVRAGVAAFAAELAKHVPCKRWLYSGGPFARENGVTLSGFDAHWLAAYVADPRPFMVFGRQTIAWQYTDGRYGPAPRVCPGVGAGDMSIIL
jgi:Glycosyl hydrolases family 25